jgi:hypothetical protein
MVEDRDNLNSNEDPQNDGHEFLPLDFSEGQEEKDAMKDLRKKYFPGSSSESEEIDDPAEEKKEPVQEEKEIEPIPEAKPAAPVELKEESTAPENPVEKPEPVKLTRPEEKEESAAPVNPVAKPEPVKLTRPVVDKEEENKPPAKLHEIFPEDKHDEDDFPKAEHKRDPEVEKIKQKFETEKPLEAKPVAAAAAPAPKEGAAQKPAPSSGVKLSPKREPIRIVGSISSKNASFGQILQEARVRSGLSLNQVEQSTKIKMQYLESIEMDDLKNLPPLVYVNAYVKNLCMLYNISPQETELILSNVKQDAGHVVSEEIIHHLEGEKQVNTEEEQRTKRFMLIGGTVILFIAGALVAIGIFLATTMSSGEEDIQEEVESSSAETPVETAAPEKKFQTENLESLIIPQSFTMDELPDPDTRN